LLLNRPIVLLVEDNPDDVDLTLRAFRKHGLTHKVVVTKDGVEALDFLFARGEYAGRDINHVPQLVLLDINLPKVNGLEVLKAIRQHEVTKMVPVVMLSSSNESRDLEESYALCANSYIRKQVSSADFTQAMGDVVRYWLVLNEQPERLSAA
jgi:two-component system response regulator